MTLEADAAADGQDVLARLASTRQGLSATEAAARLASVGPNAIRSHHARFIPVLLRQLRSPLLVLLVTAATASYFVGERTDAIVIGAIVAMSVGLGFGNEFRAEKAAEALHDQLRHVSTVVRDGRSQSVDVVDIVPGDVVLLALGMVVPADLRLLETESLECDESVLTGESSPVEKDPAPSKPGAQLAELTSCALMGTVVHGGSGIGVVTATGGAAEFGRLAQSLGERHPETQFQVGLRQFSFFLVKIATALTTSILVINLALSRPLIDALLFSLAIAVGVTPQLLPAVVATSLAAGSRRLVKRKVLVKRLVCIEDLGDIEVLLTDKTGTLTEGRITFMGGLDAHGQPSEAPVLMGLLANDAVVEDGLPVSGNSMDIALWTAPQAASLGPAAASYQRLGCLPFDHVRQRITVLVRAADGCQQLITKGAPEAILDLCAEVAPSARTALAQEFSRGSRVVAVASRPADKSCQLLPKDEKALQLLGFLVFRDPPRSDAGDALRRLAGLGITVKVVTGDNAAVAARVCAELGLPAGGSLTGLEVSGMDDEALAAAMADTSIYARMSPEDKARVVRAHRRLGADVAFLGDGVNDALALHAADVGISVENATDVARDAADVVLLEKSLDVLADGVVEGRRVFANTIKYIFMGTASNFGNMFSAAGASAFLSFLPMLPSQILLNNLLYDSSQLAIPTDRVDEEQLARPSRWDIGTIRRFMLFFGPISSAFDFATFGVLLWGFSADATLFRSGWFIESLATQTLVIFVVRTRRTPSWRSRPGRVLSVSVLAVVAVGTALPYTPLASYLGFTGPSAILLLVLAVLVAAYLVIIEYGKRRFYRLASTRTAPPGHAGPPPSLRRRRLHRRAARFSTASPVHIAVRRATQEQSETPQ